MKTPDFLPLPLASIEDYAAFIELAYSVFEKDFVLEPTFMNGVKIVHDTTIENGKTKTFWHLISEDEPVTGNRLYNYDRISRVPWIKPIIINNLDISIKCWETMRGKHCRICLWLFEHDYIVVLNKNKENYFLITAYFVRYERKRKQLENEYVTFIKAKNRP